MNVKSPEKVQRKPIGTWLSDSDYQRFLLAAAIQRVKPAAYLRSIVVDAVADDERRYAKPSARSA